VSRVEEPLATLPPVVAEALREARKARKETDGSYGAMAKAMEPGSDPQRNLYSRTEVRR
jgi:hypothetical protein